MACGMWHVKLNTTLVLISSVVITSPDVLPIIGGLTLKQWNISQFVSVASSQSNNVATKSTK